MVQRLKIHVLDTGALLTNWIQQNPEIQIATTPAIIEELKNRPSKQRAEALLMIGRVVEESPDPRLIPQVVEAAKRTGDLDVLSDTDIQLLALALSKKSTGFQVTVVSSDLALLNTSEELGMQILDPHKRMKDKITWIRRCPACGYREQSPSMSEECPTCGTIMRRVPTNRKRLDPS